MRRILGLALVLLVTGAPREAAAQQTMSEVLSFLLTNRSIPTGDFAGDAQAAAATRDAITRLLIAELSTQPFGSPASGFTYRLDPSLGINVRSSESFGPFFSDRSLTTGALGVAFGFNYREASFDKIDGVSLRDGRLIATASRVTNEPEPFDIETLTLRLRMRTLTFSVIAGLTDRLDVSAAVPAVTLDLEGQRVDTYRGQAVVQATADARSYGIGDVVVRAKYNVIRSVGGGVSVGGDIRFATRGAENLIGAEKSTFTPKVMASIETGQFALHASGGYTIGGRSREVEFQAALTGAAGPRLTVVGEIVGRRFGNRLTTIVAPHPTLSGIETLRLSASDEGTTRLAAVGGIRWNAGGAWVVSANLLRPLTDAGLTARWVPTVSIDYSVGR